MSLEQDVAAARGAIDALEQACATVTGHFRDTVDARRLRVDIARLREDLTLLCGVAPRPVHDPYRAHFDALGSNDRVFDDGAYDDGQDFDVDRAVSPGRRAR
jgi:hypothetical protein